MNRCQDSKYSAHFLLLTTVNCIGRLSHRLPGMWLMAVSLWFQAFVLAESPHSPVTIAESPVRVSWELVTNFTQTPDVFEARFMLHHAGQQPLGDSGWGLYFNMAPRPIRQHPIAQMATVEHLNGDWYRLVPNPGFHLKPGESIEIRYLGVEAVIKESDAPLGLYFVFDNGRPESQRIERVANYQIVPFSRPEQINRGPGDQHPIPSPQVRFQEYSALHQLPLKELPPIVPTPFQTTMGTGSLRLKHGLWIEYAEGLKSGAEYLSDQLQQRCQTTCQSMVSSATSQRHQPAIRLSLVPTTVNKISSEAYRLEIDDSGVDIIGNDPAGLFYGIQSLLNLLPLQTQNAAKIEVRLPHLSIADAPRFGYRGLHVDVSRNFQSVETIERILDVMAMYKLNRLLLYTTEDEGWRLEIPGLPELTQVGAVRQHNSGMSHPSLHPAYGSGTQADPQASYGSGYYTRDQFIGLLKYAAQRHIKILPEVNFPAHARAAIKAMEARYQRLMSENQPEAAEEYRLVDPLDTSDYLSAQFYKDNVVSVARPSTYRFYQKVLDEISDMYAQAGLTMDELHTGGDEVPTGAWTQSPLASQLLKSDPEIGNAANLQTYFFRRLLDDLEPKRIRALGWEEVFQRKNANGNAEPNPEFVGRNAVAYIWNNLFDNDLGNRLANAGYQVVLCNVSNFYFDLAYDKDPQEPGLYWAGFVNERDAWTFAPYNYAWSTFRTAMGQPIDVQAVSESYQHLKPESRSNILGVQAQLWSETIKGRDMIEYYMLPKLIGFAESAWAAQRPWETMADRQQREQSMATGWNVMANCIGQRELPRLGMINGGYNYRVPPPGGKFEQGWLKANTAFPGLVIRYTLDGSQPGLQSAIYQAPLKVDGPVSLRAFDSAGQASRVITVSP
jgi:hexosaminidase